MPKKLLKIKSLITTLSFFYTNCTFLLTNSLYVLPCQIGNVFEHFFDVKRSFNICIEAVAKEIQRFGNTNFQRKDSSFEKTNKMSMQISVEKLFFQVCCVNEKLGLYLFPFKSGI